MPLMDEDDDVPLLGRTASRPDPLPMDGFQEENLELGPLNGPDESDGVELTMSDVFAGLSDLDAALKLGSQDRNSLDADTME